MKGVKQLSFSNLHFQGSYYTITIIENKVKIFANKGNIKIETKDETIQLQQGNGIEIDKQKLEISK